MRRLISVTPGVMLSRPQPEEVSARAGSPAAALSSRSQGAYGRIIMRALQRAARLAAGAQRRLSDPAPLELRLASRPGGRLVDAADQPLKSQREAATLLFCEEASQLAFTAV